MTNASKAPAEESRGKVGVIVLGMHRSGTSALSGILTLLGCDEPATLMPPHPTNPKGFFQSQVLYLLNTRILASAGLSWQSWRPMNPAWFTSAESDDFAEQAKERLISEFSGSRLFALKDPRLCQLLPLYIKVMGQLDIQPVIAHAHRNPLDVAASLHARDGIDPDLGQLIWLRHVLDAERNSRGLDRSFLSYDQLLRNWRGVVDRLGKELGISWPQLSSGSAAEIDSFLTPALRHHEMPKEMVLDNPQASVWISTTYGILQKWAEHGELAADQAELDRINTEFSRSANAFARLIDTNQAIAEKGRLKAESEANAARATDNAARLAETEARLVISERDRMAAQEAADAERAKASALADKAGRVERLSREIALLARDLVHAEDTFTQERARKTAELDELRKTMRALENDLARHRDLLDDATASRNALHQDLQTLQSRMDQQSQHIAQLEHVRDALLNSTSWKISEPLRRCVRLFRARG